MPGYVYISFGRTDLPYVTALVSYLAQHGITGWADAEPESVQRFMLTGQPAIEGADAVLLVMSPASAASSGVASELNHAASLAKPMFTLLLAGEPFPVQRTILHEDVTDARMPSPEYLARLRVQGAATAAPMPPGPAESRSGLWVALAAGVVVLLVAGGVGTVLWLNRGESEPVGAPSDQPTTPPNPVEKTVEIGVDLPFHGAFTDASADTYDAISLYLEHIGWQIGPYRIQLNKYDNAPAPNATWDGRECIENANRHLARTAEVAVLGPLNSGCTRLELPILGGMARNAMLMVSHANSYPGLTKSWDVDEPSQYYPAGVRTYARVVTPDDDQGVALATYAVRDLHVTKCFVLNDTERYGTGIAKVFVESAKAQGIQVVGQAAWVAPSRSYVNVFPLVKASGADCVVFAGIFDNHGAELMRDKVAALGSNDAVKVLAPDGFTGYPEFNQMAEADGVYLSFCGLVTSTVLDRSQTARTFADDFRRRYGHEIRSPYALYGVQALQVILAALEQSDGTRAGVRSTVLSSSGVTIPAQMAILGKTLRVNPSTGDPELREVTIEQLTGGQERVLSAVTLT